MKIKMISMGQSTSKWDQLEVEKYTKRLTSTISIKLIEVPMENVKKRTSSVIQKESKKMLSHITPSDHVIALNANGKTFDSESFANTIQNLQQNHSSIAFLIGGPEGLSKECIDIADMNISLSLLLFLIC